MAITLGQRMAKIRKEQNVSMRAVARASGMSVAYVSKIERDEANPTVDILERLADVLGVNLNELTVGVGDKRKETRKPDSLIDFIDEYSEKYPELRDPDMQRLLNSICLRGQYPKKSEDWLMIFLNIRRALN